MYEGIPPTLLTVLCGDTVIPGTVDWNLEMEATYSKR